MGDHDAVLLHQRGLVIGAVDAVRHDSGHAAAEQAVPAVALAVEFCAGAQLGDPRDLTRILGQVTLRRYVVFSCQFAETAHILVTRAGVKRGVIIGRTGPACRVFSVRQVSSQRRVSARPAAADGSR